MSGYSQAVSTESAVARHPAKPEARGGLLLAAFTLWQREIVRFYRMPARVVGVIASPIMFWIFLGSGFGSSLRGAQHNYFQYFFPGALTMIVLFTSIFTMMSVIEDRREGFLLSVLVAPVSRSAIVLGKVLGGSTLAAAQGMVFLVFAPFIGIHMTAVQLAIAALAIALTAFSLTALGFAIAWRMDSSQGFHAVVNMLLIPLWMLSGAIFPISGASFWIRAIMHANPLTYAIEALRAALFPDAPHWSPAISLSVLAAFAAVIFLVCFVVVSRRRTLPA